MRLTCYVIAWLVFAPSRQIHAQDTVYFPPTDRIAVRAMRSIPTIDVAPGVHVRTVVGPTAAFSLGDFDSAAAAPLHHHTREQADVGISGVLDMTIGKHVEPLGPGAGVVVPPNVEHSIANRRGGVMTVIEFHAVPRPDLVPPRPAMTFPSSTEPVPVADGRRLTTQLDVRGDDRVITGATCKVRSRRVTESPVDLHPTATSNEVFVYVMRGDADVTASGRTTKVSAGTLVIIPAGLRHVTARARGTDGAAIVEFTRLSK